MPPQPGVFALPYASTHKARAADAPGDPNLSIAYHHHPSQNHQQGHHGAGPSRSHGSLDDPKKDRKRKEIAGKLGKEMSDRRDDGRQFAETITGLHTAAAQLSTRPAENLMYNLRLYPISLERSALLAQLGCEEKYSLDSVQNAYEEERERVEEEWKKGREKVRERLLEGIEERRRRARDEKEGEGTMNDASLDSQSRPHITRKLRNKIGSSPPPTPLGLQANVHGIHALGSTTPLASTVVMTNPHSLSVDELPSPFPLPLTSVTLLTTAGGAGGGTVSGSSNKRRPKGGGSHPSQAGVGGLGKSLLMLNCSKEADIEADLGEIRRGNKRRRATAVSLGKS